MIGVELGWGGGSGSEGGGKVTGGSGSSLRQSRGWTTCTIVHRG